MNGPLLLLVSIAGGIGAALRYVLSDVLPRSGKESFPARILAINVVGSFGLGLLTGLGTMIAPEVALIVGVGLLGGFTTFSTVQVDTVLLARQNQWSLAALNLLGTAVFAVLSAVVGLVLATWIVSMTVG